MVLSGFLPVGRGATGTVPTDRLRQPDIRRAFGVLKVWAMAYLVASVLTLAAVFVVPHGDTGEFAGVWIRCAVVVLIAGIIAVLAVRSEHGHRRAYRILRVFVYLESLGFILVALIVPGYPLWLRIAQGVIGLFAVGTAVATGNGPLRRAFAP